MHDDRAVHRHGHVEGDEDIRTTVTLPPTGAVDTVFYDAFDLAAGPLGANWIPATAPMDEPSSADAGDRLRPCH